MRRRMSRPSVVGSMPKTVSLPSVMGLTVVIIRMVDVFPAPLGPRNPNASPLRMSKSIESTAVNDPKVLVRPRASTRFSVIRPAKVPAGRDNPQRPAGSAPVVSDDPGAVLAATELAGGGVGRRVPEGHGVPGLLVCGEAEELARLGRAMQRDRATGHPDGAGGQHHVLGGAAQVEVVPAWFADQDDGDGRVPDRLGEVAAFGEALKPVVVGHDDEGPVLPVLRAPGPTCCLQDGVQVLTGEGALLVVADRTQREDLLVEVGHVPRLERGQPLGYRMSWVHRNNASVLPVASSSTSTSQSWVVRPPCTIRPSVTIDPSRSVDKKLVFNSMVVNPDAPSGRLATQPNPAVVSARATTAPACM